MLEIQGVSLARILEHRFEAQFQLPKFEDAGSQAHG